MKRNLYLKTVSVEEALNTYLAKVKKECDLSLAKAKTYESKDLSSLEISTYDALGRTTSEPVFAKCCSPLFNAAAMDGIAVNSKVTKGASEANPITLELGKDYVIVDTGDPIRSPYDAVIMAEDLIEVDNDHVKITESCPGWQYVRPIGEDIVIGEMIMPSNHVIRAVDMGVMLASGNVTVKVKATANGKKIIGPSVGIIPTGTEIIEPYSEPKEGDIIDSNSGMFIGACLENNAVPKRYSIVPDDYELIKAQILKALDENDMVITNAGSSAGTEDYTVHILREIGEVVIHGVSMKPGKPVILAIAKGKPVIGLPGYPVSAYLAFENFVKPVIELINNKNSIVNSNKNYETSQIEAIISKRIVSSLKHREYVRVKVGKVGDNYIAAPLARGASAAMSLVRADGFLVIPQNSEGYEAGEKVKVDLFRNLSEIESTLVSIGSHDMLMDLVNDMMAQKYPELSLSSTHVGSMGGLMALKRHETVIAPTHLLDEKTGEYNVQYLKDIFTEKGEEVCLLKGVDRIQGIMVKKGNPLGIYSVSDLTKGRFVNRQRGAGTRVLLDYKLKKAGLTPEDINGYEKEVATHMAVAASVAGPEIDCGMGIKPAADAMGLDFIEVGIEEYDFAIYKSDLENPKVKAFIEVITSSEFRQKLTEIGGYGFTNTGKIVEA